MLVSAHRDLSCVDHKPVFSTRVGAPMINLCIKDFDETNTAVYHVLGR
jgi:hypothetical protein